MASDFDHIANNYDQEFTSSPIGKGQRDLVFKSLANCIEVDKRTKILEINCGTGEDALHFGNLGADVIASDISEKMVSVADKKTAHLPNVSCISLDINNLSGFEPQKKFDLIFSNFGGLNCLSENELRIFFKSASQKLTDEGLLALVIMPNFCLWETFYFATKLQFSNAFRRRSKSGVMANIDGEEIRTYYYSPSQIIEFANEFTMLKTAPIGFYTPPSYLNNFFQKKPKTIKKLINRDKKGLNKAFLSSFSDHFLICLQKK